MKPLLKKIFDELEETRGKTFRLVEELTTEEMEKAPEGEWSVAQVLEHLYQTELGSIKVVKHVIKKSEKPLPPYPEDDSVIPLREFRQPENLEAPEVVQPGEKVSADEVMERLREIRTSTRETLEFLGNYDPRAGTFPHPLYGDIHLAEWFAFLPDHERLHQRQIEKIIGMVRGTG